MTLPPAPAQGLADQPNCGQHRRPTCLTPSIKGFTLLKKPPMVSDRKREIDESPISRKPRSLTLDPTRRNPQIQKSQGICAIL